MSNASDVLYEILKLQLSPWLDDTGSDEKYIAKLAGVKDKEPAIPLKYKIDFPRPFNNKTKYYSRLISNAAVDLISENITKIAAETDESIILFLLDELLDKNIKNRIRRVGELIKEMDYAPVYISNNFVPTPENSEHKTNAYIIQFFKLAYMQIYLEIQDEFKQYRGDILIAEDFYSQLLNEPVPDHIPIYKISILEVDPQPQKTSKVVKSENKTPIKSFLYKKLATKAEYLNDLRDSLIKNGFIAEDTSKASFKNIFSGKTVITPVVWIGLPSELSYFIKLIHNEHHLVEDLKQKQWKIVPLCFVDKENNPNAYLNIRKLQRPETKGHLLDEAVKLLF